MKPTPIFYVDNDQYGKPGFYMAKDLEFKLNSIFPEPTQVEVIAGKLICGYGTKEQYVAEKAANLHTWIDPDGRGLAWCLSGDDQGVEWESDNYIAMTWQQAYNDACDYLYTLKEQEIEAHNS